MVKMKRVDGYGQLGIGSGARVGVYIGREYIRWLLENERASAALYAAFGAALPKQRGFWRQLEIEELAHADVVQQLQDMLEKGTVEFKRPRFDLRGISEVVEWTRRLIAETQTKGVRMQKALEYALALERTMVETNFFDVVRSDSEKMRMELEYLRLHTIGHIGKIRAEASRLKWRITGFLIGREDVAGPRL